MYIFVSKIIQQKNPNKESNERKWIKSHQISIRSKNSKCYNQNTTAFFSEAPVGRRSSKKVLSKVTQYSQENKSVFL